jgi:thiamine thiazole synthase
MENISNERFIYLDDGLDGEGSDPSRVLMKQNRESDIVEIDERIISKAIVERFYYKLLNNLEVDVAIVGGGPAGLVAGYYLSRGGLKIALYERKLSVGGGMWGGGMMFNEIVVQETALDILDDFGIRHKEYEKGHHTADSIEAISTLISHAVKAGVSVFNCISVEDVLMRPDRVIGVVLNWSAVEIAGLHVDPLAVRARYVIDATGHATEVVKIVQNKVPGRLSTPSGKIEGEKSMWSERAESLTLENTREVFPGLFVAGMSANATFGGPRMGAIFGGMLLSGRKVAHLILNSIDTPLH